MNIISTTSHGFFYFTVGVVLLLLLLPCVPNNEPNTCRMYVCIYAGERNEPCVQTVQSEEPSGGQEVERANKRWQWQRQRSSHKETLSPRMRVVQNKNNSSSSSGNDNSNTIQTLTAMGAMLSAHRRRWICQWQGSTILVRG